MEANVNISFQDWKKYLELNNSRYNIYAPIGDDKVLNYNLIRTDNINRIVYNSPKPITPIKLFFIPIKENVIRSNYSAKTNLIIGIPSCDLLALDILDEIYLNKDSVDTYYKHRRDNTILVGADCFSILEHCHCNSYNIKPYPYKNYDVSFAKIESNIILVGHSPKGYQLLSEIKSTVNWQETTEKELQQLQAIRNKVEESLKEQNKNIPNGAETSKIVAELNDDQWAKHSKNCVSCGACATICPTCTCFLLIDKPGFNKVRSVDACQYPGFAKIAAGEDVLNDLHIRFKNRYMCKYVWKPEKFESIACTGCGRCIETCIGNINKNEIFIEHSSMEAVY